MAGAGWAAGAAAGAAEEYPACMFAPAPDSSVPLAGAWAAADVLLAETTSKLALAAGGASSCFTSPWVEISPAGFKAASLRFAKWWETAFASFFSGASYPPGRGAWLTSFFSFSDVAGNGLGGLVSTLGLTAGGAIICSRHWGYWLMKKTAKTAAAARVQVGITQKRRAGSGWMPPRNRDMILS